MSPRPLPPDPPSAGGVYWMESSKRRQALDWLARSPLTADERTTLERFVRSYRTDPGLTPDGRRALLRAFERIARRLRPASTGRG